MSCLAGLPTFVAIAALTYLVAESGSRVVALGVCGVLFVWLLVGLRDQAGAEDPAKPSKEKATSAMHS